MRLGWGMLAFAASASGCVSVVTKTTYDDQFVRDSQRVTPIDGSTSYSITTGLEDQSLTLKVVSKARCQVRVTHIYHRVAHNQRTVSPDATSQAFQPGVTAVAGLVIAGLGTYSVLDANGISAQGTAQGMMSSPSDVTAFGTVLIGVGVGLGVIALIDHGRLQDSNDDLGNVAEKPEVSEKDCNTAAAANVVVVVATADRSWTARATTGSDGVARVSLHDVPEQDIVSQRPLSAVIDDVTDKILLSSEDTTKLVAALAADRTSKLALEREARAAAKCHEELGVAQDDLPTAASEPRDIARVEVEWTRARDACGDKWTEANERDYAAFRAAIESGRRDRAAAACNHSVDATLAALDARRRNTDPDSDPIDVEALLAPIRESCKDVPNAGNRVQAVAVAARAAAVEDARRKHAYEISMTFAPLDASDDAVAIVKWLGSDPEARSEIMSLNVSVTFARIAQHWVTSAARDQSAVILAELCASRTLLRWVHGDAEWSRLRRAAIELDVVAGNRVARAMDGCK